MSSFEARLARLAAMVRSEVRDLKPYAPEPAGPPIRLDANESPYDLPAELKSEIGMRLQALPWNRYPDPEAKRLKALLAQEEGVQPEQIVLGNGSDELIRDLLTVFGAPGAAAVFPTPTFSMYPLLTHVAGLQAVEVPLQEDWTLDLPALQAALQAPASRILFLASPNNPTGMLYPREQVQAILEATDRLVVVDEAYRRFAGESVADLLATYPNLAVLNTFSKSMSLAGLRVGYLAGHPHVTEALNKVRLPYNVDALAQSAAEAVLRYPQRWQAQAQEVMAERERVFRALQQFPALKVYPSRANFILVRSKAADELRKALADQGIAVRGFSTPARLADCLRITLGRPEENTALLTAVKRALAG